MVKTLVCMKTWIKTLFLGLPFNLFFVSPPAKSYWQTDGAAVTGLIEALLKSLLRKGPHACDFWCIAIAGLWISIGDFNWSLWISNQHCLIHFQCFFTCIPCFKVHLAFIFARQHYKIHTQHLGLPAVLRHATWLRGWNVSKSWSLMFEVGALVSDILIYFIQKNISFKFFQILYCNDLGPNLWQNVSKWPDFFGWLNFLQHPVVRVSAPAFFENFRPFRSLLLRKNCPEAKHKPKGDQNSEQSFFSLYKFFLVL